MMAMRVRTGILALAGHLALTCNGCVIDIADIDLGDDDGSGDVEVSAFFSRTVPVQTQSALSLVGTNGTVSVQGQPGAQEVTIQAQRWVRADTRREAKAHLPLLEIAVGWNSEEVEIRSEHPKESHGRTYGVDYQITVPWDFSLHIVNGNGTVEICNVVQEVWVESGNGDVVLESQEGSSWVSLGNGEIRADVVLPDGGQLVHSVGNGIVNLTVQKDVSAEFTAQVGNGAISVTGLAFTQWVSGPRFAEGVLGDGIGRIALSAGNGWIQVQGR